MSGSTWMTCLLGAARAGDDARRPGDEDGTAAGALRGAASRTGRRGGAGPRRARWPRPRGRPRAAAERRRGASDPILSRPARERGPGSAARCAPDAGRRGKGGIETRARSRGSPTGHGSPRVSSRAVAASSSARATSVRLRTSAAARSTPEASSASDSRRLRPRPARARTRRGRRRPRWSSLPGALCAAPRPWCRRPERSRPARTASPGCCDPHRQSTTSANRDRACGSRSALGDGPDGRLGAGRRARPSPPGRRVPKGSRRRIGRRRPSPPEASSKQAGWRREPRVQATSPAAQRPGSAVAPSRSTSTPPDM